MNDQNKTNGQFEMRKTYECWAYKDGRPWKVTHVIAENYDQAEGLAWKKFYSLGIDPDLITRK